LMRAIEIAKALGKVPSLKINKNSNFRKIQETPVEFLQIGIPIDREKLAKKIEIRLKERFKAGMVEEISSLYKKYNLSPEKIQIFGIAYSLVPQYEKKEITLEELFNQIVQAEKNYAKRQTTWFKKDSRIFWSDDYPTIQKQVYKFFRTKS